MEVSMSVSVIVCNGCCCGNLEKGYDEVPVEFLEQAWVENNLGQEAQLTISGCLRPCSMRNVVLLKSEDRLTWLGGLSGGGATNPLSIGPASTHEARQRPFFPKDCGS